MSAEPLPNQAVFVGDTVDAEWFIEGIQFEVFKRILPEIQHDLISPFSAALIQAGIVKRKTSLGNLDTQALLEDLAHLETQMKKGVSQIKALKNWETGLEDNDDAIAIVRRGNKLFRNRWAIRNIELKAFSTNIADTKTVQTPLFLLSWLTVLAYLEDLLSTPASVEITQTAHNTLNIQFAPASQDKWPITTQEAKHPITKSALTLLTRHASTGVVFHANGLHFSW